MDIGLLFTYHTLTLDLQGPHSGDPPGRRRCTEEEEAPAQAAVPLPKVPQGVELALGAQTSLDHAFQREGETGCLSLQMQGMWERFPVEEGLGTAHEASHRRKAPGLLSLWQEVCHQVGSLKKLVSSFFIFKFDKSLCTKWVEGLSIIQMKLIISPFS